MDINIADKKKKELFIAIFHLLKNSSSQINAMFHTDHLHVQGMDKSHVCLFDLNLKSDWFTTFTVNETCDICFDSNLFYSMISVKSEDQNLNIKKVSEDNLNIELVNGDKKGDFNKFFTMSLIDFEYDQMNIPSTEYDSEFSLQSKKVTDIMSQLSNFGDDLHIKCCEDFVDFKTKGNTGDMRVNVSVDDLSSYSIVEGEEIMLTYSLPYVSKMCITNKLSTDIEFSLSNDYPMKINYDLGNDSSLSFYIAPKLSDD